LTKEERAAARRGDRRAFWTSRAARGDPIAKTALAILNNAGIGAAANASLAGTIRRYSPTALPTATIQAKVSQIGVLLMQAHVSAISQFGSNLTSGEIVQYHRDVFASQGLPPNTFGGAPLTGTKEEAFATAPLWRDCGR